jgi:hypothetical protein
MYNSERNFGAGFGPRHTRHFYIGQQKIKASYINKKINQGMFLELILVGH